MPEIKAFQAMRYNNERIDNLADVICQPYDQISNRMQRDYKNKSPYNFVRLVLTKYAEGHDRQREYRDAKKFVDMWIKERVFVKDTEPAIYPYWQEFTIHKQEYVRKGFISLLKLEELGAGNILPHEKTLSKPKADRLNLLRITQKDFEPIFLLYTDQKMVVNKMIDACCAEDPIICVKDDKNVTHKLWCITDPDTISKIASGLKNSVFVIADGHHRYETAYTYSQEHKTINTDQPKNYKMVTLVNIEDPGLVILPTHRLIMNVESFDLVTFLENTERYFDIKKTTAKTILEDLAACKAHAFGFYSAKTSYILTLKSLDPMKKLLGDRSDAYRNLDVAILHTLLIEDILGVAQDAIENHVRYERGLPLTLKRVQSGEFQFAFIMNPTRPEQVRDIALKKERMPQKSTDFFPKLISGIAFYDLAE
jgi:uncharacterized protein (DUF1015 family)